MFRSTVEYACEVNDIDKLRDFMECAHRNGYRCKYTTEHAAGRTYFTVTITLDRFDTEQLVNQALSDRMDAFHQRRLKERNAELEDARREGYAKAVEDMTLNHKG